VTTASASRSGVVAALLQRHGSTFAEELGIDVRRNTPSPLFRLLCVAMLSSARINWKIAVAAARALAAEGWTTAEAMAGSTWAARARTLNAAGYARYDERTSSMLGELSQVVLDRYRGDLRGLRAEAGRDPASERRLLKMFKGMGDVGVDIFFREVQVAWKELVPFVDRRALAAARRLRLGDSARALARLSDGGDFARLVAALVRTDLEGDHDAILEAAASR
jgi:hypothetical protein